MEFCLLTTADSLSVGFNSCASTAGSETEPQNVSERSGEKTKTGARIVIGGSEWPKACKAGAGVSQEDGNLTSQCRQQCEQWGS